MIFFLFIGLSEIFFWGFFGGGGVFVFVFFINLSIDRASDISIKTVYLAHLSRKIEYIYIIYLLVYQLFL